MIARCRREQASCAETLRSGICPPWHPRAGQACDESDLAGARQGAADWLCEEMEIMSGQRRKWMFSIDSDNTIVYGGTPSVGEALPFDSAKELAELADAKGWSREFLESIWNSFAGAVPFDDLRPVKKFRNRPFGIRRIWEVIQRLRPGQDATASEPEVKTLTEAPRVEPKEQKLKPARAMRPKREPRTDNKRAEAIRMLQREHGATLQELMDRFGWQRHSVRGFISTLGSKHGIKVISEKHETKGRIYRSA